jgi:hypothetical protein
MQKTRTSLGRLGETMLYLFGFWIALTVLVLALPWTPADAFMQSAKIVLLLAALVALVSSVIGATTGLLSVVGMSAKDPEPRP